MEPLVLSNADAEPIHEGLVADSTKMEARTSAIAALEGTTTCQQGDPNSVRPISPHDDQADEDEDWSAGATTRLPSQQATTPKRTSLKYEHRSNVPLLVSDVRERPPTTWHTNVVGLASGQSEGTEAIDNDADWAKEVKALFGT